MRSMIDIQIEEKIFTKSKLSILKGFSMQVGAGEKLAIVENTIFLGRRRMSWMRRCSQNGEIKELDLSCKNQQ